MLTGLIQNWRLALGLSGLFLFAGGPLHPEGDAGRDFDGATLAMLADPNWVPSHALMLVSFVFLLLGLIGLMRSGLMRDRRLAPLTTVAVVGAALAVVEGVLHLAAVVDAEALRAGRPTPILNAHLALAVVAYPAMGLPFAALAWFGGLSRVLTHPLVGAIGALGGISHGLAAPIVVLSRDQRFSFLFMGAIFISIWLIVFGISHFRQPRRGNLPRASASPG